MTIQNSLLFSLFYIKNGRLPLTLKVALTTGEHYCAACDVYLLDSHLTDVPQTTF